MTTGLGHSTLAHPPRISAAALPRWVVILCAVTWLAIGLFGRQPYKPDEAYTVGLVKSMVDGGDWVVPKLVGEPFMEKPPLFFMVAAVFAERLSWLPLHEAARFAVVAFVAIGLFAIAASARAIHGRGAGRLAVVLALATVGAVVRLHQLITDTGLFAGVAVGLLGLVQAPRRPYLGGVVLGAGIAISLLCKGLLGPGLFVCTALGLLALPPWRQAAFARTAVIAGLVAAALAACWLVPLELRAPDQFHVWFYDNNLGRLFGLNDLGPKKDLLFYAYTLLWYALPCWPLAMWGWLRLARGEGDADERLRAAPPLVFTIVGVAVLTVASDGRELYALILVPALSVAATGGLLAVPVRVERWLAWAVAALFLLLTAGLLGLWATAMHVPQMTADWPEIARLPQMVAPSMSAMALYAAVACILIAMLTTLRRTVRGTLPLAGAAGIALLWASLMLPWGAYLDELKGYRQLALALGDHLPATGCVASAGLGEGERALFDYFIGLRTRRVESGDSEHQCSTLLVQSLVDQPAKVHPSWQLRWQGARDGADTSVLRLYVRAGSKTR